MAEYTLAHIKHFKLAKMREYEANLKGMADSQIEWKAVNAPGKIDQPSRVEYLQLADLTVSATAMAFRPD